MQKVSTTTGCTPGCLATSLQQTGLHCLGPYMHCLSFRCVWDTGRECSAWARGQGGNPTHHQKSLWETWATTRRQVVNMPCSLFHALLTKRQILGTVPRVFMTRLASRCPASPPFASERQGTSCLGLWCPGPGAPDKAPFLKKGA